MHAMLLRLFSALALLCTTFALQAKPIADTLFAAYDDVLPQSLLKQIAQDCPKVNAWTSNTGDSFMHGKRATFWLPTSDPPATPRNSIEEAVLRLSKYALKDMRFALGLQDGLELPVSAAATASYAEADEVEARGEDDFSAVYEVTRSKRGD